MTLYDLTSPGTVVSAPPKPMRDVPMTELMRLTYEKHASDLHLKVGTLPVIRINGELEPQSAYERIGAEDMERLYREVTSEGQRARFEQNLELDLSYGLAGVGRFRINIARQRGTLAIAMRSSTAGVSAEVVAGDS